MYTPVGTPRMPVAGRIYVVYTPPVHQMGRSTQLASNTSAAALVLPAVDLPYFHHPPVTQDVVVRGASFER